jgi:alkanesulfonate monooxygenase SsuD/methylene tetrahydromethanopterin reductase-like flavin-dependent oxidoreductase (luciferase family)
MLDQMSGGRLLLGVGRGVSMYETASYGLDFAKTQAMYHEAFQVLLQGLGSDELSFQGEFYKFDKVPMILRPVQKPHPPLWYGAGTPQSVERPAATGMSIVTNAPATTARTLVEHYWKHYKGGAAQRPKTGFTRHLVVADTDEEALAIARRGYRRWQASFMKLWLDHGTKPVGVMYPTEFDGEGMNGRAIAGSPQTVLRELQSQVDESGANYILCRMAFGDLTFEESRRSVELFAEHVMPKLRARQPIAAE